MVRRWVKKVILKALEAPEDWSTVLEDTLLSMGCELVSVDQNHKLRMMLAAPLEAADLKRDRDYWREEAFRNACEADKAERRARAWKAAAKAARRRYAQLIEVSDFIDFGGG
jgi:hypothetical protein